MRLWRVLIMRNGMQETVINCIYSLKKWVMPNVANLLPLLDSS